MTMEGASMKKSHKLISLILLILSVIFFILSIAGIVGVWVIKKPLIDSINSEIQVIRDDLNVAEKNLTQVEDELDLLGNQIDVFQTVIEAVGDEAINSTQVVSDVVTGIEEKISPLLSSAESGVNTLYETFISIKTALEVINNLPLIEIEVPGGDTIQSLLEKIETIQEQINTTQDDIENIARTTEELITTLTNNFQNWEQFVDEGLQSTATYKERITYYDNRLTTLEGGIPTWINTSTVLITITLLWLAFSQTGLFILAWSFYKNQDLLLRWRQQPEEKTETEK